MKKRLIEMTTVACALLALCLTLNVPASAQTAAPGEHDAEILGVRIGMDVPTALEAVFVNAKRKPGEERPDAKRNEGKDVRVVYKKLAAGELQIVFADGKWVREVVLTYAAKPYFADLHLAPTGSIAVVGIKDKIDSVIEYGGRYDDRYSIGYTSDRKLERFWWRDEPTPAGYRVRVGFVSERLVDGQLAAKTIARKTVGVTPGDEEKFKSAMAAR
ncbi:MAG TPA: hypothetical protein VGP08_25865 [Pyrinomonadaceae bacterium]|jgi:hypothetical protein|nr:hypothetical protein [Pyrinomonadaceae bacterium]